MALPGLETIHLPDGQTFTVKPVFGGLFFSPVDGLNARSFFPTGWLVSIHTEDHFPEDQQDAAASSTSTAQPDSDDSEAEQSHEHRFADPTLQDDVMFIASVSNPSDKDYQPAPSESRYMAMRLWITLYWYFHRPAPSPHVDTAMSKATPDAAKPKADWRIRIKRAGMFSSRNIIPKFERMGLISTMDSAVGTSSASHDDGSEHLYVTQAAFWQIPFGLFLFSLQPKRPSSHPGSPLPSRPGSPVGHDPSQKDHSHHQRRLSTLSIGGSQHAPCGPYYSASRLPTYYPPPPLQYTMTENVRHPLRQKPPRMGEIFYTRFVPSVGKYLSFRVVSSSDQPVPYLGPVGPEEQEHLHLMMMSDTRLLQLWLSNPRVKAFWGEWHPNFLTGTLNSKHAFPAIGMWDGVPFGYFEIYWVKEDPLGRILGPGAGDWDRGLHVLVGEEWARGKVPQWLSSLAHWCWQADNRTMNICLEPRIDNFRLVKHLHHEGFAKEREVTFPHKQSFLFRMSRDVWKGPTI